MYYDYTHRNVSVNRSSGEKEMPSTFDFVIQIRTKENMKNECVAVDNANLYIKSFSLEMENACCPVLWALAD